MFSDHISIPENYVGLIIGKKGKTLKKIEIKYGVKIIVEDNNLKHNKFVPGVNIPIYKKNKITKKNTILVLAWNFFDEIKKNNQSLSDNFINIKDLEYK